MTGIITYLDWARQRTAALFTKENTWYFILYIFFVTGGWFGLHQLFQKKYKKLIPVLIALVFIAGSYFLIPYTRYATFLIAIGLLMLAVVFLINILQFYTSLRKELGVSLPGIAIVMLPAAQLYFYEWLINANLDSLSAQSHGFFDYLFRWF